MTSKEALKKVKRAFYKLADYTSTKESELLELYGLDEPLKVIQKLVEKEQHQEKLLKLYKELVAFKDKMLSCCEVYKEKNYDFEDMGKDLLIKIWELDK